MSASHFAGRTIFTVAEPPPGTHCSLLRAGSPVTRKMFFPSCIAGTVFIDLSPVHSSHGGVAVSFAPSASAIAASWRASGHVAGSNALPGLP